MKIKRLFFSSAAILLFSLCTNVFAVKIIKKAKKIDHTKAKVSDVNTRKKVYCACCCSAKDIITSEMFSSCKLNHNYHLCKKCYINIKSREPQMVKDFLNCKLCKMYENIQQDAEKEKDLLLYLEKIFNSRIFQSAKYLFYNVLENHDRKYNRNFCNQLFQNNTYYFRNLGDLINGFDDNDLEIKYLYDRVKVGKCFIYMF